MHSVHCAFYIKPTIIIANQFRRPNLKHPVMILIGVWPRKGDNVTCLTLIFLKQCYVQEMHSKNPGQKRTPTKTNDSTRPA